MQWTELKNTAYANSTPPATHPFSIPLAAFEHDLAINTSSTYAAAQQAIQAFEALPDSIPKAFIFTGNILNTLSMPSFLTLGIGKSASASLMQAGANSYGERGYWYVFPFLGSFLSLTSWLPCFLTSLIPCLSVCLSVFLGIFGD